MIISKLLHMALFQVSARVTNLNFLCNYLGTHGNVFHSTLRRLGMKQIARVHCFALADFQADYDMT